MILPPLVFPGKIISVFLVIYPTPTGCQRQRQLDSNPQIKVNCRAPAPTPAPAPAPTPTPAPDPDPDPAAGRRPVSLPDNLRTVGVDGDDGGVVLFDDLTVAPPVTFDADE